MLIEDLAYLGGEKLFKEAIKYPWPIITEEIERAVVCQLHTTLGTYDRSGITKEFEDNFSAFHGMDYALVTSSGTAALHSAYYALGLGPGDEVIAPNYTFFATVMPLFQLGAIPVLADSTIEGSFDPEQIELLLTKKTKAVVVTHMWGHPCDMDEIVRICKKYGLLLIEDCSHAHGAKYKGSYVGTFGDIGIWSLQSQKIIAAGEAGILLTNNKEYYDRAQLLGHYNKRALQEIDKESIHYKYAYTGTGLKYRPGALGLTIANIHLASLSKWTKAKRINAERIRQIISDCPGIYPLQEEDVCKERAYYAFVFVVDPKKCGFSREDLVTLMQYENFMDIDIPGSTSCLHHYNAFIDPISPVHHYNKNECIRGNYEKSIWISEHAVKISVPIDYGADTLGNDFLDSFEKTWKKVTGYLYQEDYISNKFCV